MLDRAIGALNRVTDAVRTEGELAEGYDPTQGHLSEQRTHL